MVRVGIIVVMAGIMTSMGLAMFFYWEYRPNVTEYSIDEQATVGPGKYTLIYEGTQKIDLVEFRDGVGQGRYKYDGDQKDVEEKIGAGKTFMKISIFAEDQYGNTLPTKQSQFTLQGKDVETKPLFGEFVGEPLHVVAYFPLKDEELDEESQYILIVWPTKEQESTDLARVCITNCA